MDTHLLKKAASRPKRRQFSDHFKLQIVMQSMAPGASPSALALANGLHANQVFKWRRKYLQQQDEESVAKIDQNALLPVVMAHEDAAVAASAPPPATIPTGRIDITLRHGQIRIEGAVDTDVLRSLVQSLRA